MSIDERIDRLERLWLLVTADTFDTTAVDVLVAELRANHPAVVRSGGQLILAPIQTSVIVDQISLS